jgi:acetyl esterase/lipase
MAELHPGARDYVERVLAAPMVWEVSLEDARRATDDETLEAWGELDGVAHVEDREVDGIRIRIYRPQAEGLLPAIVYFHGGGWVVGTIDSHDPLTRALAARTPAVVVSVGYRLAPEHPFPAAVDDALTVTQWVAEHGTELDADTGRLVVAGDSAGGNLAAVVAARARDEGPPLALQVLIYPVTDADLDSSGYARLGEGLNLTRDKMEWYWGRYLQGADPAHPHASPLRTGDLVGVAPALVQTAEYDPLADEGAAYAKRLRKAGVPVTLTQYEGQIHGFVRLPTYCGKDADEAIAEIGSAVRAARPTPRSRSASPY